MATKSSIHIKPCNAKSSEAHNRRTAEYMRNIRRVQNLHCTRTIHRQRTMDKPGLRQPSTLQTLRPHQTNGKGKDWSCHAGKRT